jgi:hypothetical protein
MSATASFRQLKVDSNIATEMELSRPDGSQVFRSWHLQPSGGVYTSMRVATGRTLAVLLVACASLYAADSSSPDLSQLIIALQSKAKILENSSGMRKGFESFITGQQLPPGTLQYSDYVLSRLLYEAARDAGFWNLHWTITNHEPNSDYVWQQWSALRSPSPVTATADAECDELSALYAFLMKRAGVRGAGLFWPYSNHTVAVWVLRSPRGQELRVVVPTSQIFLSEADFFGTHRFDPWRQKQIHEYTRRDVPDDFRLPQTLFDFLLRQVDRYAGASNTTLQQIRYLREGVLQKRWKPEDAARFALNIRSSLKKPSVEDSSALWNFAEDMRASPR